LLVFSIFLLAILYYPLGFASLNSVRFRKLFSKDSYRGLTAMHIIGSVVAGMVLSFLCTGILFRMQHWQGGQMHLIGGLVSSLGILIFARLKYARHKGAYYLGVIKRILLLALIGIPLVILSDLSIIKLQFRNHPGYIKAYELYMNDPENETLVRNLDLEYQRATMSPEDFELYLMYLEKQK
jgi:hypothetical protein